MKVKKGEIFNSIEVRSLPRNTFDLTHQHATTINFGELVPICLLEAVPGDVFNISSETFIRLQPMITPMMHRCDFTVHYFFVPNRILWPGWEDFITGNLALSTGLNTPAPPYFTANDLTGYDGRNSLCNFFGIEVNGPSKMGAAGYGSFQFNALPFAAYQKIYFDYYVAKELTNEEFIPLTDGPNDIGDYYSLWTKGWGRDYFTSALPYAQKGNDVALPTGTIPATRIAREAGAEADGAWSVDGTLQPSTNPATGNFNNIGGSPFADGSIYFPETEIGVTTINDLRRAMRLQEWLEKNARAGTRYTESLKAHFNVNSSDARLQRAEYITGVRSPIIVSEVLNTTGTEENPQGNMAGHAIGIADSYNDSFYCEEHGIVMGILSVTPKASYSTGVPRLFTKRMDYMDYYWNEFANIGEQEIDLIELQCSFDGTNTPTTTFGYIPRYSEYKFKNDMITGDFADASLANLGNLRTWVMQRTFGNAATFLQDAELNEDFIVSDILGVAEAPFAVPDTPILVQQLNKVKVSRQMPVYGTPTF